MRCQRRHRATLAFNLRGGRAAATRALAQDIRFDIDGGHRNGEAQNVRHSQLRVAEHDSGLHDVICCEAAPDGNPAVNLNAWMCTTSLTVRKASSPRQFQLARSTMQRRSDRDVAATDRRVG
jgi:hypothetical protein